MIWARSNPLVHPKPLGKIPEKDGKPILADYARLRDGVVYFLTVQSNIMSGMEDLLTSQCGSVSRPLGSSEEQEGAVAKNMKGQVKGQANLSYSVGTNSGVVYSCVSRCTRAHRY